MPLADYIAVSTDPLLSDELRMAAGGIPLRPSLRAAMRLERVWGFPRLAQGVAEGSLLILSAIVRECADKADADAILSLRPIGTLIRDLQDPCHRILLALAGHDIESDNAPAQDAKPVPFAQFYASLYRLAAGNLGWPPEQALSASPLEIVEAVKGRTDLLHAIFGTAEKPAPAAQPIDPADSAAVHSAGIARLREIFGGSAK